MRVSSHFSVVVACSEFSPLWCELKLGFLPASCCLSMLFHLLAFITSSPSQFSSMWYFCSSFTTLSLQRMTEYRKQILLASLFILFSLTLTNALNIGASALTPQGHLHHNFPLLWCLTSYFYSISCLCPFGFFFECICKSCFNKSSFCFAVTLSSCSWERAEWN